MGKMLLAPPNRPQPTSRAGTRAHSHSSDLSCKKGTSATKPQDDCGYDDVPDAVQKERYDVGEQQGHAC